MYNKFQHIERVLHFTQSLLHHPISCVLQIGVVYPLFTKPSSRRSAFWAQAFFEQRHEALDKDCVHPRRQLFAPTKLWPRAVTIAEGMRRSLDSALRDQRFFMYGNRTPISLYAISPASRPMGLFSHAGGQRISLHKMYKLRSLPRMIRARRPRTGAVELSCTSSCCGYGRDTERRDSILQDQPRILSDISKPMTLDAVSLANQLLDYDPFSFNYLSFHSLHFPKHRLQAFHLYFFSSIKINPSYHQPETFWDCFKPKQYAKRQVLHEVANLLWVSGFVVGKF
jgi:hypothetical protein